MLSPSNNMIVLLALFVLLPSSSFVVGLPVVSMLLPGFRDEKLVAELLDQVGYFIPGLRFSLSLIFFKKHGETSYLVKYSDSGHSDRSGAPTGSLTAIIAPTAIQLISQPNQDR